MKEKNILIGRIRHSLLVPVLLCAAFALLAAAGLGPACPICRFTGFYCPMCGASRMAAALLRLDFAAAFRAHAVLLLLLPVIFSGYLHHVIRYIRTGVCDWHKGEKSALWGAAAVLLITGVLRNLPAFAFLAPH